jgi:geranylgeranyl pyrophosphate synthase
MVEGMARYGRDLGMAFQLVDDLLDYRGDEALTGKPRAVDFREGCVTLPLIYLRDALGPDERDFLRGELGTNASEDVVRMVCGWMEARGAYRRAAEFAEKLTMNALESLSCVPASPDRDLLVAVTDLLLHRAA